MSHGPDERGESVVDFDDFFCTYSEEEVERSEQLMSEVKTRLTHESQSPWRPLDVSDGRFLTSVVISLNWDFGSHITTILNAQWSAVLAEADDGSFKTWVGCDQVEHGIAATWKAFATVPRRHPPSSRRLPPYAAGTGRTRHIWARGLRPNPHLRPFCSVGCICSALAFSGRVTEPCV